LKYLLDTHALLWWCDDDPNLSIESLAAIGHLESTVFVSAAVAWEIVIKVAKGKLKTPGSVEEVIRLNNFRPLPIQVEHAVFAGQLPLHHADPFDRMLVAQAKIEGLTLVTRDEKIIQYGVDVLLA
jgi:PIN domain nuclease of toxin-antitoxin system